MDNNIIIAIIVGSVLIISLIIFLVCKNKKLNRMKESIKNLDIRKNVLDSKPILVELSKIEELAKSEQIENKLSEFKNRYEDIKNTQIIKLNDMIVELDYSIESKDYKDFNDKFKNVDSLLKECEDNMDLLLNEISDLGSYEDKYREIVIKEKNRYRSLQKDYINKEGIFGDLNKNLKLQFENIEKRFNDFDIILEEKLYNEVKLVVNGISVMIDNLEVVLKELPDIMLIINDLIPNRIKELKKEYELLTSENIPLGYMNFDNNIAEIEKRTKEILDRARILNIDNSLFDLKSIIEYLDDLFKDFEKEKQAKIEFDNNNESFEVKLHKFENTINSLYDQMDDIKVLYGLKEKDLEKIERINLKFSSLLKEYKALLKSTNNLKESYLKHNMELYSLIQKLAYIDEEYDKSIRSLGKIYDDESRAKKQLVEIKEIIMDTKEKVRKYNLLIIYDRYFVELKDAEDAILELEKELSNKPIVVKTLNIRSETARDLAFKLYTDTMEMIKHAYFTEILVEYANRYRDDLDVARGLNKVEMLYYKGEYEDSYKLVQRVLEIKEKGITKKIEELCKK